MMMIPWITVCASSWFIVIATSTTASIGGSPYRLAFVLANGHGNNKNHAATPTPLLVLRGGGNEAASTEQSDLILRIRLPDGSQRRLKVTNEIRNMTIATLLTQINNNNNNKNDDTKQVLSFNGNIVSNDSLLLSELPNLRNGSLLSITTMKQPPNDERRSNKQQQTFVPFPDLAKKWNDRRYRNAKPTSYAALSNLRDATLHRIDANTQQRIQRLEICSTVARRFLDTDDDDLWLCLGSIKKQHDRKSRHSLEDHKLSSTTTVATVQALVRKDNYDWQQVANYLGLQVIGCIVSQTTTVHETALVPTASAILQAAELQIHQMKQQQQQQDESFTGFCVIAMDRTNGATEAYQIQNVAVQMVSEGLLITTTNDDLLFHTKHSILVDGQDTQELDAVLCLVNTAVASHTGIYTQPKPSVKTNGRLTKSIRSKLIQALLDDNVSVLERLVDFELLVALYKLLKPEEGQELCETVKAYAKGRKKTTELHPVLRKRLVQVLSAD